LLPLAFPAGHPDRRITAVQPDTFEWSRLSSSDAVVLAKHQRLPLAQRTKAKSVVSPRPPNSF
jgi:hypothetical protein